MKYGMLGGYYKNENHSQHQPAQPVVCRPSPATIRSTLSPGRHAIALSSLLHATHPHPCAHGAGWRLPGGAEAVTAPARRRALLALGAALTLPGCALQRTPNGMFEDAPPVALPGTREIALTAGGHRHRIMLALPPAAPPARGWPVLYVLDGDLLFAPTAQIMRNRFARGPGVPAQGAVVVGLGYAGDRSGKQVLDLDARSYDYTPPAPGPGTDARGRPEGGADAFLDFIDAAVRPLVERSVRVDTTRQTLMGHSYGGLCVLHALFTRPGGFQNYVAASPSVWWRDGAILQSQARFVAGRTAGAAPLRLLITQGEREAQPPADPARAALVRERRGSDRLQALVAGLRGVPGLDMRLATIPGADHGGSMLFAAQQALELAMEERA